MSMRWVSVARCNLVWPDAQLVVDAIFVSPLFVSLPFVLVIFPLLPGIL